LTGADDDHLCVDLRPQSIADAFCSDRNFVFLNNNFFCGPIAFDHHHLSTRMRFKEFSGRYNLAQANEELKKLDVLKSQFFANVSHEVRTPLTSIMAPVQSLYQGDVGPLQPEHQRLIGQVYINSLKLLDMINQMLDFSKFEAGKMQLRLRYTDLDELARDILDFSGRIERKVKCITCGTGRCRRSTWTTRSWSGFSPT
jgi:signal transduction histidine kinase